MVYAEIAYHMKKYQVMESFAKRYNAVIEKCYYKMEHVKDAKTMRELPRTEKAASKKPVLVTQY